MSRRSPAAVIFVTNAALEVALVTRFVCGPVFQDLFGLSNTQLGVCLGTTSAGSFLMSLVVGRITDRRGSFPILVAGLVLGMCGAGFVVLATGFGMLLAGLAVVGASTAFIANANVTFLADLFRDKLLRVMSLAAGLWFGSSALAAPAIGAWVQLALDRGWETWSFRTPYLFDLALLGGCLVLAWRVLRPVASVQARKAAHATRWGRAGSGRHDGDLPDRQWLWILLLTLCHGTMIISLLAWVSRMIQDKFAANQVQGALVLGVIYLGLCAGRFILSTIEVGIDERILLASSAIVGAVLLALGLVAPTYHLAIVALGLGGLAACATYPSILSLVGNRFPRRKAQIYGYVEASVALVGFFGPTAVGVLADGGLPLWLALGISPLAGLTMGLGSLLWKLQDVQRESS